MSHIELNGAGVIRGLPPEALNLLREHGSTRTFARGAVLMRQGEAAETVHVITRGRVRVERSHPSLREPLVLAELGAGEVVGEMGVLDAELRSATAVAEEPTETRELTGAVLGNLVARHPLVASSLLRVLSSRIRTTNQLLAALAAKETR